MSYGISGINITSAEPAIPDSNAIHPAFLPITSHSIILWCDSAVVWSLSNASVTTSIAVLNPKVTSVDAKSLSMVLGTPITLTPFLAKSLADVKVPSPPMTTSTSTPSFFIFSIATSDTSSLLITPFLSTV